MKSATVSTFDIRGGAAIATYRIHKALRKNGVDSKLFVATKDSGDATVTGRESWAGDGITKLITTLDNLPLRPYKNRQGIFSPAWVPDRIRSSLQEFQPDVVHLFWVAGGMVRIESLQNITQPIVWTLHDMWPFTGGCHYDNECGKYVKDCGQCPVLKSEKEDDLSRSVLKRKHSAWAGKNIIVVATSQWLRDCAKASSLFGKSRIELIPNCVDTQIYQPLEKEPGRRLFGLNPAAKTIFFSGANAHKDPRKGLVHLFGALHFLAQNGFSANDVQLVLLGIPEDTVLPDCPFPVVRIPHLRDEYSQVALYNAADVLVAPSLQENLANTVVEALCCGTPVVAFNVGGMPDLIIPGENGYLAQPFSAQHLSEGIAAILNNDRNQSAELSRRARQSGVSRYSEEVVARQYASLYSDLIGQPRK